MNEPKGLNNNISKKRRRMRVPAVLGALASGIFLIIVLSGCSVKDITDPLRDYMEKEASVEEETAPVAFENTLLYAQVNDSQGIPLVKSNGQPMTVLVAYETATGGEPRINPSGILETHPLGEVATYTQGLPVLLPDGTYETYAGGEVATDILGIPKADKKGEILTRAEGEIVTYGEDAIVYDENGEKVTYSGEPLTYSAGEDMYDTDGERVTFAVTILKNTAGEVIYGDDGNPRLGHIELVTDVNGDPVIADNGEAATKQLDPLPPEQIVEMPVSPGSYYVNSIASDYVFFSTPEVNAADIGVVPDPDAPENETVPNIDPDLKVNNLQLEILGRNLPCYDFRFDAEGYAYIVLQGSEKALTLDGKLKNGTNIILKDIVNIPYPQYEYWDDPICTVADNQKWIIEQLDDGSYIFRSYADRDYVMTVDDQFGIQYANIMMWKYDGRNLQKFRMSSETPRIEKYFEEGTYYISSGLSDWMLVSVGDDNYMDGSEIYLYFSDGGNGQQFSITYDEYGFATIAHIDSSKVLSVDYQEAVNGQSISQYEADGGDWQKWIIAPADGGLFYLRSALNVSEVMDLAGGTALTGNNINLHWNNNTYAQYWGFFDEAPPSPYEYEYMDDYAQNFSSETDYLILVSSFTNHVGIYTGEKGNWKILHFWDCVTGKPSTPTVKGEFTIYYRVPSFDGNMDSPEWYTCYYATGFYPEYFFHSIIYYQGTWNIMDASMGYNLSHGCVRLYTENAEWIYENIPNGTKVVSY
ncbi:MAG: RICIN domain-containing protein [Parasporobacterium sp.]|nr:RICIN domain-containing protein [Parasporobacterium sp.]